MSIKILSCSMKITSFFFVDDFMLIAIHLINYNIEVYNIHKYMQHVYVVQMIGNVNYFF